MDAHIRDIIVGRYSASSPLSLHMSNRNGAMTCDSSMDVFGMYDAMYTHSNPGLFVTHVSWKIICGPIMELTISRAHLPTDIFDRSSAYGSGRMGASSPPLASFSRTPSPPRSPPSIVVSIVLPEDGNDDDEDDGSGDVVPAPSQSPVSTAPGNTTSTLSHDRSSDANAVKYARSACFVIEYIEFNGDVPRPMRLDIMTMCPRFLVYFQSSALMRR